MGSVLIWILAVGLVLSCLIAFFAVNQIRTNSNDAGMNTVHGPVAGPLGFLEYVSVSHLAIAIDRHRAIPQPLNFLRSEGIRHPQCLYLWNACPQNILKRMFWVRHRRQTPLEGEFQDSYI